MIIIGTTIIAYGVPNMPLAVKLILGKNWYNEDTIRGFQYYCWYILVMGINGVTEALLFSNIQ